MFCGSRHEISKKNNIIPKENQVDGLISEWVKCGNDGQLLARRFKNASGHSCGKIKDLHDADMIGLNWLSLPFWLP